VLHEFTSHAELKKARRCGFFICAIRSSINGSDLTLINSLVHQNSCLDFPTAIVISARKFSAENTDPVLHSLVLLSQGLTGCVLFQYLTSQVKFFTGTESLPVHYLFPQPHYFSLVHTMLSVKVLKLFWLVKAHLCHMDNVSCWYSTNCNIPIP
jgi:hypothetical protein